MKESKDNSKTEELKTRLKECEELRDKYLEGWKRAQADFLNYKKSESEKIKEIIDYEKGDLLFKMLSALDSFEIAEKQLPGDLSAAEYIKGFFLIRDQIKDILKAEGVEEMEFLGGIFDPSRQEAAEVLEGRNEASGTVLEEIKKGYSRKDRILRPAKVKVAK